MRLLITTLLIVLLASSSQAQEGPNYQLGIAYYANALTNPGIMLELEREKPHSDRFAFLYRADLGYFKASDFQTAFLELQHGYRIQFASGLFFDQTLGLGILDTWYDTDAPFLYHDFVGYTNINPNGNVSLSPSISLGLGYLFSSESSLSKRIWLRPKAYWNAGFGRLQHPFYTLQIGFSITLK